MTGDVELMKELSGRLLCTNSVGIPDARPVEIDGSTWCQETDGTVRELRVNGASEYGSFFYRITSSHPQWVAENMDFVASISNACRAKNYVHSHWPGAVLRILND